MMRFLVRRRAQPYAGALSGFFAASVLIAGCAAPRSAEATPAPVAASPNALRKELKEAYEKYRRALLARDFHAAMAMRTQDFHAVTPDGAVHGPQEMADAIRHLLANVQQWVDLSFEILSVERNGNEAVAQVRQHSSRLQQRDGALRRIENWVTQRETWVHSPTGWKIRRVDSIRDQQVLIDGRPRQ